MIAIVSHDAGGAEILSSWLLRNSEPYCLVLEGPARGIFERKLGRIQTVPLANGIRKCDWVLCGTSWQSDLECRAIKSGRINGKRVVAFLDHWVNFRERFRLAGAIDFPDEIWVGDCEAERIAKNDCVGVPVILKENPYFEDLKNALATANIPRKEPSHLTALYVCEPIREHALRAFGNERHWGYTEEDALLYFLKHINIIGDQITNIIIRPHPSEPSYKYDWAQAVGGLNVRIGGDRTLFEETMSSDVVAGCESMAMVVGLLAGKRVISCIPPGGKQCSLPHTEIEHLQKLMRR